MKKEILILQDIGHKSLRDEMAMAALTGMLSCYRDPVPGAHPSRELLCQNSVALRAYQFADAMLAARGPATQATEGAK